MKKVSGPQVVTCAEAPELPLPAEIEEALGELVGAAKEGLLALSVSVGLRVVHRPPATLCSPCRSRPRHHRRAGFSARIAPFAPLSSSHTCQRQQSPVLARRLHPRGT